MRLSRLLHFLLVGLLILGQVATPALATQLTNLSQPAFSTSFSSALSQSSPHTAKPSCHEHAADQMTNAYKTNTNQSNTINSDCCGDECQCPMGSCSNIGLNVINHTFLSVEPNSVITFEHISPLQRYLPPLLKPPTS